MTAPPSLNALLDFLKSASLHPSCRPGFARLLQVSHPYLSADNVSILHTSNNSNSSSKNDDGENLLRKNNSSTRPATTIVRYHRRGGGKGGNEDAAAAVVTGDDPAPPPPPLSMGLWLALLDEMTTNATFLHGCPTPPGASIHMRLELLLPKLDSNNHNTTTDDRSSTNNNNNGTRHLQELPYNNNSIFGNNRDKNEGFMMDSSVIKAGKTMSFTECKIYRDSSRTTQSNNNNNHHHMLSHDDNNNLIAIGSQVKYLPTGSYFMDALFTTPLLWDWFVKGYVRRTDPPPLLPQTGTIGTTLRLDDHLRPTSQSTGRATFQMTPYLTNPLGVLHGGAQGMMMEIVGQSLAQVLLQTDHVQLVSIQVDFLSSGRGPGEVEVTADAIHHDPIDPTLGSSSVSSVSSSSAQLAVRMVDRTSGRLISTGNLRFVRVSTTSTVDDSHDDLPVAVTTP